MDDAMQNIGMLGDAVDLEMATVEETALLPFWTKYRVLLSRIDADSADEIRWPQIPS